MKETSDTTPAQKLAFIEGELAHLNIDAAMALINDLIKKAWVALFVVIFAFAVVCAFFGPLVAAKVLVCAILFGISLTCIVIFVCRKSLLAELITLEEVGYYLHEEVVLNCNEARAGLYAIRQKLEVRANPVQAALMPELIKYIGPVASMLLKKETGTLKWLMLGLKVGKNAFDVMQKRKQG